MLLTEESIECLLDNLIVAGGLKLDEARPVLDHLAEFVSALCSANAQTMRQLAIRSIEV